MLLSKAVAAVSFFIAMINTNWAIPRPGVVRERHVILTPIKIKYIHHFKIKKIPIVIKKHIHYYKPGEEVHHSQPDLEEHHTNQIYGNDQNDHHHGQFQFGPRGNHGKLEVGSFHQSHHESPEEDYEEAEQQQSKEEDYDDYEYE